MRKLIEACLAVYFGLVTGPFFAAYAEPEQTLSRQVEILEEEYASTIERARWEQSVFFAAAAETQPASSDRGILRNYRELKSFLTKIADDEYERVKARDRGGDPWVMPRMLDHLYDLGGEGVEDAEWLGDYLDFLDEGGHDAERKRLDALVRTALDASGLNPLFAVGVLDAYSCEFSIQSGDLDSACLPYLDTLACSSQKLSQTTKDIPEKECLELIIKQMANPAPGSYTDASEYLGNTLDHMIWLEAMLRLKEQLINGVQIDSHDLSVDSETASTLLMMKHAPMRDLGYSDVWLAYYVVVDAIGQNESGARLKQRIATVSGAYAALQAGVMRLACEHKGRRDCRKRDWTIVTGGMTPLQTREAVVTLIDGGISPWAIGDSSDEYSLFISEGPLSGPGDVIYDEMDDVLVRDGKSYRFVSLAGMSKDDIRSLYLNTLVSTGFCPEEMRKHSTLATEFVFPWGLCFGTLQVDGQSHDLKRYFSLISHISALTNSAESFSELGRDWEQINNAFQQLLSEANVDNTLALMAMGEELRLRGRSPGLFDTLGLDIADSMLGAPPEVKPLLELVASLSNMEKYLSAGAFGRAASAIEEFDAKLSKLEKTRSAKSSKTMAVYSDFGDFGELVEDVRLAGDKFRSSYYFATGRFREALSLESKTGQNSSGRRVKYAFRLRDLDQLNSIFLPTKVSSCNLADCANYLRVIGAQNALAEFLNLVLIQQTEKGVPVSSLSLRDIALGRGNRDAGKNLLSALSVKANGSGLPVELVSAQEYAAFLDSVGAPGLAVALLIPVAMKAPMWDHDRRDLLETLGLLATRSGAAEEGFRLLSLAYQIGEDAGGSRGFVLVRLKMEKARAAAAMGKYDTALSLLDEAAKDAAFLTSEKSAEVGVVELERARMEALAGNEVNAQSILSRKVRQLDAQDLFETGLMFASRADHLNTSALNFLDAVALLQAQGTELDPDLRNAAFLAMQVASASPAADALIETSISKRLADPKLDALIAARNAARQRQSDAEAQLVTLLDKPAQGAESLLQNARLELENANLALRSSERNLAGAFPQFVSEAGNLATDLTAFQKLLSSSTAYVSVLGDSDRLLVIKLTQDDVYVRRHEMDARAFRHRMLREAEAMSDPTTVQWANPSAAWGTAKENGDLGSMNAISSAVKGHQTAIIDAGGLLGAFPFDTFVIQAENGAARWLAEDVALTLSPSPRALMSVKLRGLSKADHPLIAWADPALNGYNLDVELAQRDEIADLVMSAVVQDSPSGVSDAVCSQALLPQTRKMAQAIADALGANPATDILMGADATEAEVFAANQSGLLGRSRVVAFNTHGLTAGDFLIYGNTQPALVLTPEGGCVEPRGVRSADAAGDGLLTVSEVVSLSLDADWVLLTACSTASGGKIGAEPLSGLSRGFFYAGARSLLVSHWPAEASATTVLIDALFAAESIQESKGIRLSRAKAKLRETRGYEHPAYWAVFFLVGDDT